LALKIPEMASHGSSYNRFGPYFCEPVIAGLESDGTPFVCGMDLIGALNFAKDFIVSGTSGQQLYGMAESLWEPNLVRIAFEQRSWLKIDAILSDFPLGTGGVV